MFSILVSYIMNSKLIIKRSNDGNGSFEIIGAIIFVLAIIAFVFSTVIIGILLTLIALFIFGFGSVSYLCENSQNIVKQNTLFHKFKLKKLYNFNKSEFSEIIIEYYSENGGSQFRTHSSSIRVKEYRLYLVRKNVQSNFLLAIYPKYKQLRNDANILSQEWGIDINDKIQNKIANNKIRKRR